MQMVSGLGEGFADDDAMGSELERFITSGRGMKGHVGG